MKNCVIQTTCKDKKEAKRIAKILLKNKLAACIQISNINSLYVWNSELCEDKEKLLNIKTQMKHFKKIKRKIKENHSYDVPEIICLEIKKLSKKYKKFIGENTK